MRGQRIGLGGLWIGLSLAWGVSWLPVFALPELPVLAQTLEEKPIEPEEIALFARIVLEMEPYRLEAEERSEQATDDQVKDQIRREFIRTATEIITASGMTVPEYNRITLLVRSPEGEQLKQQVEEEIRQLQQQLPQASPSPSLSNP